MYKAVLLTAVTAALMVTQASAQDLAGTLKKIKETGTITSATANRRSRSPTWTTSSSRSVTRWTCA
jgi:hypothetical protein